MTPGKLFLLSILCLILAGLLIFAGPPTFLMSALATIAILLALTSYFAALYLRRAGERGERALANLRERIAYATEKEILAEHRLYHREGFPGLDPGELLLFYETEDGWLLVPLLEELAWVEFAPEGVLDASLEDETGGQGIRLRFACETRSGQALRLGLGSTLHAPSEQTRDNVSDLIALQRKLRPRNEVASG